MKNRVRRCPCGAVYDVDSAKYVGAQQTVDPGVWLLLASCRACGTTFAQHELRDATPCASCGHLIAGDREDPKSVLCPAGSGRSVVFCADCAPDFLGSAVPAPRFLTHAEVKGAVA